MSSRPACHLTARLCALCACSLCTLDQLALSWLPSFAPSCSSVGPRPGPFQALLLRTCFSQIDYRVGHGGKYWISHQTRPTAIIVTLSVIFALPASPASPACVREGGWQHAESFGHCEGPRYGHVSCQHCLAQPPPAGLFGDTEAGGIAEAVTTIRLPSDARSRSHADNFAIPRHAPCPRPPSRPCPLFHASTCLVSVVTVLSEIRSMESESTIVEGTWNDAATDHVEPRIAESRSFVVISLMIIFPPFPTIMPGPHHVITVA